MGHWGPATNSIAGGGPEPLFDREAPDNGMVDVTPSLNQVRAGYSTPACSSKAGHGRRDPTPDSPSKSKRQPKSAPQSAKAPSGEQDQGREAARMKRPGQPALKSPRKKSGNATKEGGCQGVATAAGVKK